MASLPDPFFRWLVDTRRTLHRHPELAYQEHETAKILRRELDLLGVPYESGIGGTGIVATLTAESEGPVLALRADMDALPITEETDTPYRSLHTGVMHACGHDGHMTILLGVIRRLMETGFRENGRGRILFIFQPAEEGGAGAKAMLDSGFFDDLPVAAVFAGHLFPEIPVGQVGIPPEVACAATDTLTFRMAGRGGHGARPEQCIDPIVAGAALVTQLQSLISRSLSPFDTTVLTIGHFTSGSTDNVIPDSALLEGTLRTFSEENRERALSRVAEMVSGIDLSYGTRTEFIRTEGYPVLQNSPALLRHLASSAEHLFGGDNVLGEKASSGGEDFAYFCRAWGGAMAKLGCHDPRKGFQHPLHSPLFDMDERVLEVGTLLFARVLTTFSAGS